MSLSEARQREFKYKRDKIQAFMQRNSLDALLLNQQSNFAWATAGGNNWVVNADEGGVATLVFRANGQIFAVMDNIEQPRFQQEEDLDELDIEVIVQPWWASHDDKRLQLLIVAGGPGQSIGVDHEVAGAFNVSAALAQERYTFSPDECDRYREVGRLAGEAIEQTAFNLEPGLTEWQIAGRLAEAAYSRGLNPTLTLIAVDERIAQYRHPIPTDKKLEKQAMLVLCARKGGLIANVTRLVHFGPLPAELAAKHKAVQLVDATLNLLTKPGAVVAGIMVAALNAYADTGYKDEWKLHHQGGATGYAGREFKATPELGELVQDYQAFAWNPSITGTKSEDTILVSRAGGLEVLTSPPDSSWPMTTINLGKSGTLARPDILIK